jgi:hypothetical protein
VFFLGVVTTLIGLATYEYGESLLKEIRYKWRTIPVIRKRNSAKVMKWCLEDEDTEQSAIYHFKAGTLLDIHFVKLVSPETFYYWNDNREEWQANAKKALMSARIRSQSVYVDNDDEDFN